METEVTTKKNKVKKTTKLADEIDNINDGLFFVGNLAVRVQKDERYQHLAEVLPQLHSAFVEKVHTVCGENGLDISIKTVLQVRKK